MSGPAASPRPAQLRSAAQRRAAVAATFDQVADGYDQGGVRWFAPIARHLVGQLAPRSGERALDLGCGRGAVLFELVAAVGERGSVTGIDLAPKMIAATAADARARGVTNVDLRVMDAAAPTLPPSSYHLAAASFVLFFLPAPVAALRAWRRLLVPGGRLGVSTYDQDEAGLLGDVFQRYLPSPAFRPDSPFSSEEGVTRAMRASGFTAVETMSFDLTVSFADADEWCAWSWSHGQRAVWERIAPADRSRVRAAAAARLAEARGPDGRIQLTQRIRLTTGSSRDQQSPDSERSGR
jgi:ubiquinone/menaquinone biosynthesis C-methylase UbiE